VKQSTTEVKEQIAAVFDCQGIEADRFALFYIRWFLRHNHLAHKLRFAQDEIKAWINWFHASKGVSLTAVSTVILVQS